MSKIILLIGLLSVIPQPIDHNIVKVSYIEINHYYSEDGKLVFDQVVLWNYHPIYKEIVVDWSLLRECRTIEGEFIPTYGIGYEDGRHYMDLSINHCYNKIYFNFICETWTQHDSELSNREIYPKELRPNPLKK